MLYNFSVIIVYFIELLISFYFFSQIYKSKLKKLQTLAIGSLLFLSAAALNIFISNIPIINFIIFFIINCLFAKICFNIELNKAAFYSIILVILSTATEFATLFIISAITNIEVTCYLNDYFFLILNTIFSKTLYFVLCVILIRFVKKEKSSIKIPFSLYFYPFTIGMVHLLFWNIYLTCDLSKYQCTLIVLTSIVLLFSTILLFILYQHNIEKENNLIILKNELDKIKLEKNYYDILDKQNEELRIYAHDAKNHLSIIKDLNTNHEIDKYIGTMAKELNSYSNICHSGNHILDIIINKYQTECKIKNIDFKFDLKLANFNYINDYDLVTIFSNILDNAIESAEKTNERKIELFTDHKNTYDVLILTNSSNGRHKTANGEYLTTKGSKLNHGFGLKSVSKVLKKYSGDLELEYDEVHKEFTTTLMVYNP